MEKNGVDEQALIESAQRGNLAAFNQLVLAYQGLAYNVAYRLLGDADHAADATQDAFIKAYQKIAQYRGGSFKAWLLRIVSNNCYDLLRSRSYRSSVPLETDDEDSDYDATWTDTGEQPEAYAMRRELGEAIQRAIGQLPADQRTVLVLCDVEGLDYAEIAEITGAALGTVKSRLFRARARVRDILVQQKGLLPTGWARQAALANS